MPPRLTVEQVQAKADAQGKRVRVISYEGQTKPATAQCLHCGGPISCPGGTLIDPRTPFAGCKPCGKQGRDATKKKYTPERINAILAERFPGIIITGIDENTTINDDVEATCREHGYLGVIPLRPLIDPAKGYMPCRGKGCETRGSDPSSWDEVKAKLDAPGVLKPGVTYDASTYTKATDKMQFDCSKPGHGPFPMSPKQVYIQGHGCPECGKESVGEKKRLPTDEVRNRMNDAQGSRHKYPNLAKEHGHAGTGTDTPITVVCQHGHEFLRPIEVELSGAGCRYCSTSKSSQTETEISFELGQFDESWDPFDTKAEGVENKLLDNVDIKLFNGRVNIEYDPAWVHGEREDRQDGDQRKSNALLMAKPPPKAVYRIREDDRHGNPLPLIHGVTTIRVRNRATVKEIADAVIKQLISDGFLELTPEVGAYLASDSPNRSGEARAWFAKHRIVDSSKEGGANS